MKLVPAFRWGALGGYGVATLLLLLVALMSYQSLIRLLNHAAWVEHTHLVLFRLESILSLVKDAETGQRGYLLTGQDDFLQPMRTALRRTAIEQRALDSLTADNPLQQQRMDTLHLLVAGKYTIMQEILASNQKGSKPLVAELHRSKEQMDRLRTLVSRMQAEERRLLALRQQRSDQYAQFIHPLILAFSLVLAMGASWRLQRSLAAGKREQAENNARFAQLLEVIPHLTWTSYPDGTLNYYNTRWTDYTNTSVQQLLKEGVLAYIHPKDHASCLAAWQEALKTGEPMSEQRLRLKHGRTGEYRWHLAQAVPLRNMEGRIILWVGTNTDIHAQQLQQQELQQVNTDLDNFIYTASHDLKTPISNIEALLAELREELQLPAEEADPTPLLDYMQQAVERFKRTIFHLTEVVKLQKAQDQPKTRVELAELIQEVRLDLQPLIAATGGHISVDVAACPSLGFSEKNLRSIVFNLLSNALKYRHPERPPQVRISCQPNAEYFVLCVQDNGLGISLNPLSEQKLFGLFQRLHDHVEGSGIGLYMVKKMITNVGGRIEVESQPGTGSTFRVYFPK